jgi:tetratricopeptide (TPR) repeat protein
MSMSNQIKFAVTGVATALLLAGCASQMSKDKPAAASKEPSPVSREQKVTPKENAAPPPAASSPPSSPAAAPAPEVSQVTSPAVADMLKKAERLVKAKKLGSAVATLERALRLEPKNPVIWHRLASVRQQQGRLAQAADLAAKSNALLGENNPLRAQNDSIIAKASKK